MISLVVTIDSNDKNFNLLEKDTALGKILSKYREPFEIIYATTSNYGLLTELRNVVAEQKNRQLIISAPSTNINTQIFSALNYTDNGDVLLCTMDTKLDILEKILDKHFDGADIIYVQRKENWFKSIFTSLGRITYQVGLKILGRGQDLCCDSRVMYLNARSVNTIILNPALSKALRLTNPDPNKSAKLVTSNDIYETPTKEQNAVNNSFFFLGFATLFYLIALFTMALVFPIFNSGIYTGWVILGLCVWLILGVVASAFASRTIYHTRLGYPLTLDLSGQPVLNIVEYVSFNSELAKQFEEENNISESKKIVSKKISDKKVVKEKTKTIRKTQKPKKLEKKEIKKDKKLK